MKKVILKFGGTSVATNENRKKIVNIIKKTINNGEFPIVVVSAIGRGGDNYSTDTLLGLISEKYKKNNKIGTDFLMCCGEFISTVVLSSCLYDNEIDSIPLTGGQAGLITDNVYGNAKAIKYDNNLINKFINKNIIPIVAGFQGINEELFFTTFGRGGSDTTACLLGYTLDATRVEIYTDVDGVMTADPRIVPSAKLVSKLSYNEIFQLAEMGAKVVHPKAVLVAKQKNIKVYVKNTMKDNIGTIISNESSNKPVVSITSMSNRVQIIINKKDNKNEYYNILDIIAKNKISLDLISIFADRQIFTISLEDREKFVELAHNYNIKFNIKDNCSKISLIGEGMKGIPGVMSKIYSTLVKNNIEVLQTSDSHMSIWCLVDDNDKDLAIKVLHEAFIV